MQNEIINDVNDKNIEAIFKPRARLLLQLGDQLIKNESIALIELVKNSYDADANHVNVLMENVDNCDNGVIIIEDDGCGMDLNTVINVWMEPGSDSKWVKFSNRELSPKYKRLPIGDKGIGRFGVHKLGNIVEMTTKMNKKKEIFVRINWNDFDKHQYLDQVPVSIVVRNTPLVFSKESSGTQITIRSLRKEWSRGIARNIKRTISSLVSPFESIDNFEANFDILDKPDWFSGLLDWDDVKDFALYNFQVTINNNHIENFKYSFEPWSTMSKISGRLVDSNDDYIKTFKTIIDELGEEVSINSYNIGKIKFEGYIFSRDAYILKMGVSDKKGYKSYLDINSGIRVFRNGLRVYDYGEPENDWLGLDFRRVNNPGKHLSNNIVVGAIYIERDSSSDLIEKTNREGFVENKAYEAFKNSIIHVLNLIETLRYSDKQRLRDVYGPTPKSEPVLQVLGDLKGYVESNVKQEIVRKEIVFSLIKIEEDYKRICENLLKAAGAGLSMSVVVHEIEKILLEIQKVMKIEKSSERIVKLINHLAKLVDGYSGIIRKSSQTKEDIISVIDQALINTEYRLVAHEIIIDRAYKKSQDKLKVKMSRSLVIGTIMNLIDNSIYWLEKSGKSNKEIFVGLSDDEEGYINIVIADNGTGFLLPTEEVIEPFVSAKPDGMGLGLHIASEIMLAQKGRLTFPDWGDFEIPEKFEHGALLSLSFKR